MDIISTFKVFLAYYWVKNISIKEKEWDETVVLISKIIRILVIIMFVMYVIAMIFSIDYFFSGQRYGIKSYKFLFDVPGNYSKIFYFIIPILVADLCYSSTIYKKSIIMLSLLLWITTMRARAIAFAVCFVLFSVWFFYLKEKKKFRVKLINVIPIGVVGLFFGWKQMVFYFTNDTQARAQLLRYSFVTLKRYFPIGSGFGTYGSDIAIKYYSVLYKEYNFDKIFGMGYVHTNYLNDNYWPMIIGQFGIIGTICVVGIVALLAVEFIKYTYKNKYFYCATLCSIGFLLASSIASKSYSEFSTIPIFILHGILVQCEKNRRIKTEGETNV